MVIIPADRKWFRHVYGLVFTAFVLGTLSIFAFALPTEETSGRMMVPTLLMAVRRHISASLPAGLCRRLTSCPTMPPRFCSWLVCHSTAQKLHRCGVAKGAYPSVA